MTVALVAPELSKLPFRPAHTARLGIICYLSSARAMARAGAVGVAIAAIGCAIAAIGVTVAAVGIAVAAAAAAAVACTPTGLLTAYARLITPHQSKGQVVGPWTQRTASSPDCHSKHPYMRVTQLLMYHCQGPPQHTVSAAKSTCPATVRSQCRRPPGNLTPGPHPWGLSRSPRPPARQRHQGMRRARPRTGTRWPAPTCWCRWSPRCPPARTQSTVKTSSTWPWYYKTRLASD